jgi:hypothetical protein
MDVEATEPTMIECGSLLFYPGAFSATPFGTLHKGKHQNKKNVVIIKMLKAFVFAHIYNLRQLEHNEDILKIYCTEESPDSV